MIVYSTLLSLGASKMKLDSTQPTPLLGRGWGRLLPSPPGRGWGRLPIHRFKKESKSLLNGIKHTLNFKL